MGPPKRELVLQELVNTERDYVTGLSLVKKCYIDKLKDEPEFPPDVMDRIFLNVEEILAFHTRLLKAFEDSNAAEVTGALEQVLLDNRDGFLIYTKFCNHHEGSVALLYELVSTPTACAHIKSCQLLSKSKLNLESYLLSVIQRICKYPLLLKELLKATEPPHDAKTQEALDAMLFVADAVNEDKRRLENLQKIDSWESTVTGWTGPKLRDTSKQLLCQGLLTKWSRTAQKKVHSNQRWFFLFDHVLVYCKGAPACAKKGKLDDASVLASGEGLTFKGRIDTRNIALLDMEDDKGHAETNGQAVRFAFKISNQAKGKWYILACTSQDEKERWMECLLEEQQRYLTSQAGRMSRVQPSDKAALELRKLLGAAAAAAAAAVVVGGGSGGGKAKAVIRDIKSGLRTYRTCFTGEDLVTWLVNSRWGDITDTESAVLYGQSLVDDGVIHHVHDKAGFENSGKLYRFRTDDGTYSDKSIIQHINLLGMRIYIRVQTRESCNLIRSMVYHMKTFHHVFEGCELVDWLIDHQYVQNRDDGKTLGTALLQAGFIHHVVNEHEFEDKPFYYRFTADDMLSKPASVSKIVARKGVEAVAGQHTIARRNGTFGFVLTSAKPAWIRSVDEGSAAQEAGLQPGDFVLKVNDVVVTQHEHYDVVDLIRQSGDSVTLITRSRAVHERMVREQQRGEAARRASNGCLSFTQTQYTYPSSIGKQIKAVELLEESPVCIAAARACLQLFISEDRNLAHVMRGQNFLPGDGLEGRGESVGERPPMRVASIGGRHAVRARQASFRGGVGVAGGNGIASGVGDGAPRDDGDNDDDDDDGDDDVEAMLDVPDWFEEELTPEARDACLKQISERLSTYEHIVEHIGRMDEQLVTFKSSMKKTDDLLAFLPTNLHHQKMEVAGDAEHLAAYAWTTVGVFSAHNLGLANTYLGWETHRSCSALPTGAIVYCQRHFDAMLEHLARLQTTVAKAAALEGAATPVHAANASASARRIRDAGAQVVRAAERLKVQPHLTRALAVALLCMHMRASGRPDLRALVQSAQDAVHIAKQCLTDATGKVACVASISLRDIVPVPEHPIMHGLTYREDLINAQAISTLVSCLVTQLATTLSRVVAAKATSDAWLEAICTHGVFICFQSLVSTGDFEQSMLADHDHAVERLNRVTVSFQKHTQDTLAADQRFKLTGSRLSPHVTLFVDKTIFALLSSDVRAGRWLSVTAVLFTQGVNEVQTLANALQGIGYQDDINERNFKLLQEFCSRVRAHLCQRSAALDGEGEQLQRAQIAKREETIGQLLDGLEAELSTTGEKNIALLTAVEELTNMLHGITVASCKSAKDRTAMLVTLHQACQLVRHHHLHFSQFREMLKQMRTHGVRRENVVKNTGKSVFAFDKDQVENHLPSLLRPPDKTYGKNVT
ncbi:hypothetical protein PTSG_10315 [Salpingoeca rosetta]|uniref:Uncharacterized protein n=1 Tax=Salpingoeca rosetta (strain ATCC 50818 / BSB-021) TaxID=946362 RepID=F2UQY6_SALR5|nr:uncharacterized protein PTSG_10315 [Salpingoeca rosetta]EGD80041.1 hypothetical protein PTSG_10315 [Salpingoeca rosetta]|eukprot:XP_004988366.1 hypothetical protein PTSG_10315 [Salpingoeca rosetta]